MTPISEKTAEIRIRYAARQMGGECIKIFSSWFTGLPDRLVLLPGGWLCWVEVNTTGKKPSPRQRVVIKWLRGLGFTVWVIDHLEIQNELIQAMQNSQL